jgi:heme/copper-type cytochrome/quinol oxidase subunit 3
VTSLFWSYYYGMTGLHALHVIGGMIAIAVVALAVRAGRHPQRVEYVGIYWHFVDVVWIFLFPLLYLAS